MWGSQLCWGVMQVLLQLELWSQGELLVFCDAVPQVYVTYLGSYWQPLACS